MRKIPVLFFCLIALAVVAASYTAAKIMIPPSIEIVFAGVAGCEVNEERLASKDTRFEKIKWWEKILTHVYRFEQKYIAEKFVISDFLVEDFSVYHLLVMASESTGNDCDEKIGSLIRVYENLGAPIDHANKDGVTALHESVLTKNVEITRVLLDSGANVDKPILLQNSPILDMNSLEIVKFLLSKNPTDSKLSSILEMLENEI